MNIIKKCLDELTKDDFRKDYIIGLLESYYEMIQTNQVITQKVSPVITPGKLTPEQIYNATIRSDEEELPGFLKTGPVVDLRS
jgi:hypothetical protein